MTCAEPRGAEHTGHQYTHGITGEVTYCCSAHQDGYAWLDDARAEVARLEGDLAKYGRHADACRSAKFRDQEAGAQFCSCGLAAALGTKGAGDGD